MENKDLLQAEIQMLSIACTMLLGTGAGFGFTINMADFGESVLLQIMLVLLGLLMIFCFIWAVKGYIKIDNLKNH